MRFFPLVIFCLLALSMSAQIQQERYLCDTLPSMSANAFTRIELPDGIIYAGGREEEGPYLHQPLVSRIDTNGTVLWQYVLPVKGFVRSMKVNDDSTIIVASQIDNNPNGNTWGLARLSIATGHPVFEYETVVTDEFYDICPYDATRFITLTYDVPGDLAVNLCSSSTGQIISTRLFPTFTPRPQYVVLEPNSLDIFLCGGPLIARFTPTAPSTREWLVNYSGSEDLEEGYKLDYDTATGKLYLFGQLDASNITAVVARLDTADGSVQWWTPSTNYSSVMYADHVRVGSQIVTTWEHEYIGGGVTIWHVNKIDTAGNLIWDRMHAFQPIWPSGQCNSSTHYSGTSIDNDAAGNFYVGGYYCGNGWGPANWGLMKLHPANGNVIYRRGFAVDSSANNTHSEISTLNVIGGNVYCIGQLDTGVYAYEFGDQHYLKMDLAGNIVDEKFIVQYRSRIASTIQIEKYASDRTVVLRQMHRYLELSMYDYNDSLIWSQRMSAANPLVGYNMNILSNGTICVNAYSGGNINLWQNQMRLEVFHTFRYDGNGLSLGSTQGNIPTGFNSYTIIGMVSDGADAFALYTNYPTTTTVRAIRYGASPLLTSSLAISYVSGGVILGPGVLINYSPTSLLLAGLNGRMSTIDKLTLTSSASPINNNIWKHSSRLYQISTTDYLITGFSGASQATGRASVTRFSMATNTAVWHTLSDSNSVATFAAMDVAGNAAYVTLHRTMPGDSGIRVIRLNLATGALEQTSSTFNHDSLYTCIPKAIVYDQCRSGVYVGGLQREVFYDDLEMHPVVCAFDTALAMSFSDLRYGAFRDTNTMNTMCVLNNGSVWAGGGIGRLSNSNESYIFVLDSILALPQILVTGNNPACPGDSVILTAIGTGPYLWTSGDTTQSITVHSVSTYQVQDASSACATQFSVPVSVSYYAVTAPVITYSYPDLHADTGVSFQWYLNGNPIGGAIFQNFTPDSNGTYIVEVVDANGCVAVSNPYVLNDVGVPLSLAERTISVQPNPATDNLLVIASLAQGTCELMIMDLTGKVIVSVKVSSEQLMQGTFVSLDGISSGIYFLKMRDETGECTERLIVL